MARSGSRSSGLSRPATRRSQVVLLELALVDVSRWVDGNTLQREHLRLIGIGRDVKVIDRRARDQAEARRRIQKVREVSEARSLIGVIVDRRGSGGGRFESAIAAEILTRHEVAEFPFEPPYSKLGCSVPR